MTPRKCAQSEWCWVNQIYWLTEGMLLWYMCTYVSSGVQDRAYRTTPPSRSKCCWDTAGRTRSRGLHWTSPVGMENTPTCRLHLDTCKLIISIARVKQYSSVPECLMKLYLLSGCSWAAQVWPSSLPPGCQWFSSTGCLYLTSDSPETKMHIVSHTQSEILH